MILAPVSKTVQPPVSSFRAIFDRVCDRSDLTPESRAVAWEACFAAGSCGDKDALSPNAVRIYRILARTQTPYGAVG